MLTKTRLARHRVGSLLAVTALAGGLTALSASPASASIWAQCDTSLERQAVTLQPDKFRVRVICNGMGATTTVRGYLDMNGCCDKETVWFTTTNKAYYTSWAQGYWQGHGVHTKER